MPDSSGPVEYIVIHFDSGRFAARLLPALEELLDQGLVRLIDIAAVARAEDGTIAGMLTDQLYFGRNMQFTADLDAKYAALTREQVNAAIRKHFKPESLSVFVAGDFK